VHPDQLGHGAQFSPSPNGKVREVSEAKKRALAGNNIFDDAQVSSLRVAPSHQPRLHSRSSMLVRSDCNAPHLIQ
jgi:hypothetical protein